MSDPKKSSHDKIHTLHTQAHPIPNTRMILINSEIASTHFVHVPARSEDEGNEFLRSVGSGTLGNGANDLWLGQALPWVRQNYYQALQKAENEIAAERARLGSKLSDMAELERFTAWAVSRRNAIARFWRIPAGPGGLIGGEIRDMRTYGLGGRSLPNLLNRVGTKYGETGETALKRVISSVSKPNAGETTAILRGARYLKAGGAVLFVGGLALTAYDIAKAPPGKRVEAAKVAGVQTAGGLVASNVAVGVCFLLGMTGVGLVVVGVVAGVAGAVGAEKMYYAHTYSEEFHELHTNGSTDISKWDISLSKMH